MIKNTERFSDRVENYVLYRPHYPATVLFFLKDEIGLNNSWSVADIGSGTGISSELFVKNGNTVYAVEPNEEMRAAAEHLYKAHGNFISVPATAEATSLKDNSVELIIAGQAFHWFDAKAAKNEFGGIAKPNAYLVLLWNERKSDSHYGTAYEKLLFDFAPNYAEVNHRNVNPETIKDFYAPHKCSLKTFPNDQHFDFESLKGRLLSSSYAPLQNHPNHLPMIERLQQIFEQYENNGQVTFRIRVQGLLWKDKIA